MAENNGLFIQGRTTTSSYTESIIIGTTPNDTESAISRTELPRQVTSCDVLGPFDHHLDFLYYHK